ncbi:hypothetical protein CAPTEDRAFT_103666, partial [Capitella teleta]
DAPFVMLNKAYPAASNRMLVGACIDLIEKLQEILHFKYNLHLSKDGNYGAKDPVNGTWNGMMREINNFEADVSIAAMFITEERVYDFDMTKPWMDLGLDVLIAKDVTGGTPVSYLHPFDTPLWLAIIASNLICGLLVTFCSYFSPFGLRGRYTQRRNRDNKTLRVQRGELSLYNSMWSTCISFLTQGPEIRAVSLSGRLIAAFWFAWCFIIVAAYSAELTASLTVERMDDGIQTLNDLAMQSEVEYGTVEATSIVTYFEQTTTDPFPRMNSFMTSRNSHVPDSATGANRVRDSYSMAVEKFAFIYDSTILDYITRMEPCVTRTLGDVFRKMGYGIAFRKNSPYTQPFNEAIMRLREQGVIDQIANKWINGPCPPHGESGEAIKRRIGVYV